ncbi:MAG: SDR family oxidoreductase [Acidobacteria bacterium]|jgi:UDP-N-acetylglucosamine 4-epimerase|nr:SDR family oxidoreductase [Acidobacteriota bacterium]
MSSFEEVTDRLREKPRSWLVTGVAGFIGSNLLRSLLELDQSVVGLDNFATGHRANLDEVRDLVGPQRWSRLRFHEGDVASADVCREALDGVDVVLHQAALGSVPRSIEDPLASNHANVTGTLALLEAARRAGVSRFVYASSSSVYGDSPTLPKVEDQIGQLLSPYATTKLANELYAGVFGRLHGMETVGLRYFNVFGPRQDPEGAYAAVIPRWIAAMVRGDEVRINGTGETSRDFCYVKNVVQANLLAATVEDPAALNRAYNVAVGRRTTLDELFEMLRERLAPRHPHLEGLKPVHGPFRDGDVLHSLADTTRARQLLGYEPTHSIEQGLDEALDWYERSLS